MVAIMADLIAGERVKRNLTGISPRAWEHPADRAALATLKKLPGLAELIRWVVGVTTERSVRLLHLASAVRISERQFPRLNGLFTQACMRLDVSRRPELFVAQSPFLNGGVYGVKEPFVVINSALVQALDDEEMIAVLGHELGHCCSGHALYKTLLWLLTSVSLSAIPLGELALRGVAAALREWDRKSELSADRAGLLASQNPEACNTILMKLAGGTDTSQMQIGEFLQQAGDYEARNDLLDGVHKLLNLLRQTHPFPVLRLSELKVWTDSGAYQRILGGAYPRRTDGDNRPADDLREAGTNYRQSFRDNDDPLGQVATSVLDGLEGAANKVKEIFKGQ